MAPVNTRGEEPVIYLLYCPLHRRFVDLHEDCPRCPRYPRCPIYLDAELVGKRLVEERLKRLGKRVKWL